MASSAIQLPVNQRAPNAVEQFRRAVLQNNYDLRVAAPGIINSFDSVAQTATVTIAITEKYAVAGQIQDQPIPLLTHVPVIFPRAGGFSLTLPVQAGDECLVIFADRCIDSWWQSGGQQSQLVNRAHDLSDGIAIIGLSSQPRVLSAYSTSSAQLRSDDGTVVIDVAAGQVKITAPAVAIGDGGAAQALVNQAWLNWYTANIQPFLVSKGYTGPAMPTVSSTTVLQGQ